MTKPILIKSHYKPAIGGHAPSDLRDAFRQAVDAFDDWKRGPAPSRKPRGGPEPTVELRDQQVPIGAVFGLLWNCSDILPGDVFDQVHDMVHSSREPKSRTYSAGARALKAEMAA